MIRRFALSRLVLVLALAAPLLSACGSDEGPPPPAPAGSDSALAVSPPAAANSKTAPSAAGTESCTEKQVRECRVDLGPQGTVQNCFVGLELCRNGVWGSCLSAAEVEAELSAQ
jgi:hypothetical protein